MKGGHLIHSKYERLVFLFLATILTATILLLADQTQKRAEYIAGIEEKLLREVKKYQQLENICIEVEEKNRELSQMIFLQKEMKKTNPLTVSITTPSGFAKENLEYALEKLAPELQNDAEHFIIAEKEYGINCIVTSAIAIHESGGGRSKLAKEKNNLFGIGAYDYSPHQSARAFDSRKDCIFFLTELLATEYTAGGKFYGGEHNLKCINKNYASDPLWAHKVACLMRKIIELGGV